MTPIAPQAFRTLPARTVGWTLVVVMLAIGFVVVRTDAAAGEPVLVPLAAVLLGLSVAWALLLRPCVLVGHDSVQLRNLVTDTTVPFSRLAEITHRWSLELTDTAGRTHGSWAIPVRRDFARRTRHDDFADATALRRGSIGVHAEVVATELDRQWQRWQLDGGVREPEAKAERTWAMAGMVPMLLAAVLFGAAVLVT